MSRQFSIRPLLRIPIKDSQPHASTGTGKPYPKEMREQVITCHLIGLPRVDNAIRSLQTLHKYPCNRTIKRWISRYNHHNHILLYRYTGNYRAE